MNTSKIVGVFAFVSFFSASGCGGGATIDAPTPLPAGGAYVPDPMNDSDVKAEIECLNAVESGIPKLARCEDEAQPSAWQRCFQLQKNAADLWCCPVGIVMGDGGEKIPEP